jgi:hypothetical protein
MNEFIKGPLHVLRRKAAIRNVKRELHIYTAPKPFQIQISNTLIKLAAAGIPLVQDKMDDLAVSHFARQAEYEFYYPGYYANRDAVRLKKIREHYVAARLLNLDSSDVYLDIASQYAPTPQIYERLYGCQVFRQDLEYADGRHGRVIGGSAGRMELDGNSITKAAMHCSLEHFEGDEDIALFKEVERILVPGGLFVVVPLYLADEYFIFSQPSLYAEHHKTEWPKFDLDAALYSADGGNRHERYYDVEHFLNRIVRNTSMDLTICTFGSETIYFPGQMRFAAIFRKNVTV